MRIAKRAMFRKPVCPKLKQKYFNQRHHGIGSSDRKRLAYPAPSTTGLAGHSSHGFPFICAHPKQFPLLPPPLSTLGKARQQNRIYHATRCVFIAQLQFTAWYYSFLQFPVHLSEGRPCCLFFLSRDTQTDNNSKKRSNSIRFSSSPRAAGNANYAHFLFPTKVVWWKPVKRGQPVLVTDNFERSCDVLCSQYLNKIQLLTRFEPELFESLV